MKFYKDKENIYLERNVIEDTELSFIAKGIYMELVYVYPSSLSLDDFNQKNTEDELELKEAINQLLDKKIIIKKGWKYQVNTK